MNKAQAATMRPNSIRTEPFFLPGKAGQLFGIHYAPSETPARGSVLAIAPFGEEMNRCRSLMAQQARAFAEQGMACLLLDLFGTGDSEGSLVEATWETWTDDLQRGADWLERKSGHSPIPWGFRFGALLAAEMAATQPQRFSKLLLWAPVLKGKSFVTQTLRLRVAALIDRKQPPEKTNEMRQTLEQGGSIEVSGYVLPGALTHVIDTKNLDVLSGSPISIDWIEAIAEEGQEVPMGTQKLMEDLQKAGVAVSQHVVSAPAIWGLHHQMEAPAFIEKTTQLFQ